MRSAPLLQVLVGGVPCHVTLGLGRSGDGGTPPRTPRTVMTAPHHTTPPPRGRPRQIQRANDSWPLGHGSPNPNPNLASWRALCFLILLFFTVRSKSARGPFYLLLLETLPVVVEWTYECEALRSHHPIASQPRLDRSTARMGWRHPGAPADEIRGLIRPAATHSSPTQCTH